MVISVQHPREGALDSQLLVTISELSVKGARGLPVDFHTFHTGEFAEKLLRMIQGEGETEDRTQKVTSNNWNQLGCACTCFFKRTPTIKYMCVFSLSHCRFLHTPSSGNGVCYATVIGFVAWSDPPPTHHPSSPQFWTYKISGLEEPPPPGFGLRKFRVLFWLVTQKWRSLWIQTL